jgi:hypothetical protein
VRLLFKGTHWSEAESVPPLKHRNEQMFATVTSAWTAGGSAGSKDSTVSKDGHDTRRGTFMSRMIRKVFGRLVFSKPYHVFVAVLWTAYMSVSVYYCFGITEGLDPVHLVPNDHYLVPYFTNLREFWHVGPQLHVMVAKPPNLADGNARQRILQLVSDFETLPRYGFGRNGTTFWLLSYYAYLQSIGARFDNTTDLW